LRHRYHLISTSPKSLVVSVSHVDGGGEVKNIAEAQGDGSPFLSDIIGASVAVGSVTAVVGFLYGKILGKCVQTLWTSIPAALAVLLGEGVWNSSVFIAATVTLGGILVGTIASRCGDSAFTVADFVEIFSSTPGPWTRNLPRTREVIGPVLLLSLVTSMFGFSVGPEGPMVCAGALIGSSAGRRLYGSRDAASAARANEILAFAGAAGTLTAFMSIPVAGSIFALELARSGAAMSPAASDALVPTIVASMAAIVLIRGVLNPGGAIGGHFAYFVAEGGALGGRTAIGTALGCGVGGALLGTIFQKAVAIIKGRLWAKLPKLQNTDGFISAWKKIVPKKAIIGLLVGILSANFPQTLFWGEGSLQCVVDGQRTAFSATKHGLSTFLTAGARIDPSMPFATATSAMQVGAAKLLAIALACAGKFPGGIIFPLFFAAAPFAHAATMAGWVPVIASPAAVMALMASTQASVTKTPLSTGLILALTASVHTPLSVLLPVCLISSYVGVFLSGILSKKSYFTYSE